MYTTIFTGSHVALGRWCCAPVTEDWVDSEPVRHFEMVVPVRGRFIRECRGETVSATPNMALFAGAGEGYRVRHPRAGGDECAVILLGQPAVEDMLRCCGLAMGRPPAALHGHAALAPSAFLALHALLRTGLDSPSLDPLETIETIGVAVCSAFVQAQRRARSPLPRRDAHRASVLRATEYIAEHYPERLTLRAVAREAGFSPFYFARLFRRNLGVSVHGYVTRLRLREALNRVLDGASNLTELALQLGFSSHSHFTDAFARQFGVPPSRLRRPPRTRE